MLSLGSLGSLGFFEDGHAKVVAITKTKRWISRVKPARTSGTAPMTRVLTSSDPCSAIEAGRSLRSLTSAMAARFHLPFHTARDGFAARFPASAWPEAFILIPPSPPHSCRFLPQSLALRCRRAKVLPPFTRVRSSMELFVNIYRYCKARMRLRGCTPAFENV